MPIVDVIIPCFNIHQKWCRQILDWTLVQVSNTGVRRIVVAGQNLRSTKSPIENTRRTTCVNVNVDSDGFFRSRLINAAFDKTEGSEYVWVIDFNMRLSFQKAFSLIDNKELMQPYVQMGCLSKVNSASLLNGGLSEDKRDASEYDSPLGDGSFIIKRSLFDQLGKMLDIEGSISEGMTFGYGAAAARTVHCFQLIADRIYTPGVDYYAMVSARKAFEEQLIADYGKPNIHIVAAKRDKT